MIWVIMIGFMILGGIVSSRLKSKVKKYSQVPTVSGMSGKEIAERMLSDNGINDVKVISVPGKLTDHYNPMDRTVNLSPEVYQGRHVTLQQLQLMSADMQYNTLLLINGYK